MQCDLLYNIGDLGDQVDMAIIAFDGPVKAAWPLDEINTALESWYNSTLDLPWFYPVYDAQGCIGWVLETRNERFDPHRAYWNQVEAHAGGYEHSGQLGRDTPYVLTEGTEVVVYPIPFGPELPVEPINAAINTLMGQDGWLESGAIYLYPVKKGGSSELSGLLLADTMHDLAEDDQLDDTFFKKIRDLNQEYGKLYKQFPKQRYTV